MNYIADTHLAYGNYSVDFDDGMFTGRSVGGTAVLWNKSLKVSTFKNVDESIIGLKKHQKDKDICLINVYSPFCCYNNIDSYQQYLAKLNDLCENLDCTNLCLLGDFNASDSNLFGPLLNQFSEDSGYKFTDKEFLPQDTFTYFSDAHGSTSWIDHCLTSESVHQAVESMQVLHDYISFDHSPLVVIICCS